MRATVLFLLLAALAPHGVRAQSAPTDREYAVWSALIDTFLVSPGTTRVVLFRMTAQGDRHNAPLGSFDQRLWTRPGDSEPIPAEVLQSFVAANASRAPIDVARLHIRVPAEFVGQARYEGPTKPDDPRWRDMGDGGYPGSHGTASLSRVGFSPDGHTALVFLGMYCGALCAQDTYFLLTLRDDGRWVMMRQFITSVS
jgi:hypothetical protein